jgi:AcrR family transcriptional regulator
MATSATDTPTLRQTRERELVAATRKLFDERGVQDAGIKEIAQEVGIARGLIYRQFSSRDELYILTVTDYLRELGDELEAAIAEARKPSRQLERCTEVYASYCQRYPAFLDCSLALMKGPARELYRSVSESVWLRLGQGMGRCLDCLAGVLRRGAESGEFRIADADYTANLLWTQALGAMHLARLGIGVRQVSPGIPDVFRVDSDEVVRSCVESAMAIVRA